MINTTTAPALQSIDRAEALQILFAATSPIRPLYTKSLHRTLTDTATQHLCKCGMPIRRRTKACMSCSKDPRWYERAVRALEMRSDGFTWQEIADRLGYAAHESAHHAARTALERRLLAAERAAGAR